MATGGILDANDEDVSTDNGEDVNTEDDSDDQTIVRRTDRQTDRQRESSEESTCAHQEVFLPRAKRSQPPLAEDAPETGNLPQQEEHQYGGKDSRLKALPDRASQKSIGSEQGRM